MAYDIDAEVQRLLAGRNSLAADFANRQNRLGITTPSVPAPPVPDDVFRAYSGSSDPGPRYGNVPAPPVPDSQNVYRASSTSSDPSNSNPSGLPGFYTPPNNSSNTSSPFQPSPIFSSPPPPPVAPSAPISPGVSTAVDIMDNAANKLSPPVPTPTPREDKGNNPGAYPGYQAPDQQNTGINNNIPVPPQTTSAAPSVPTPPSSSIYTPMDKSQIEAEAAARIAKQRAGVKQAVDATKTGLKNTFDYNTQLTNDRRTLDNGTFQRNNSPFSGQTDYLTANMLRDRTIQDTAVNKDFTAATGAADQKLADFDTMAPEQQQNIMNDLQRIERSYGIDLSNVTGMFNGQKTASQSNADRTYDLALSGQTGQLPASAGGGQTLAAKQQANNQANQDRNYNLDVRKQHVQEAQDLSDRYGIQVNPTDDYQLMLDQVKGMPTTTQRTGEQKAQTDQQSQAWKASETLGYIPPQYADILGIPAYTQTQQAKQQAMSNAVQQRNAATAEKNAQTNADKANLPPKPDKNSTLGKVVSDVDQMTPDNRKAFFKEQKANIIAEHGINGYNQLYNMYYDKYGDPVGG